MGGTKRPKKFFHKHNNNASKKFCGKKSSEKSAKNVSLYLHEYSDQKMGGKKRETIFPETQE